MAEDTRFIKIESDSQLGQFLDTSIEQFLSGDKDVTVTEIDPNVVPEDLME